MYYLGIKSIFHNIETMMKEATLKKNMVEPAWAECNPRVKYYPYKAKWNRSVQTVNTGGQEEVKYIYPPPLHLPLPRDVPAARDIILGRRCTQH